jgi:class 3 adenylate cyclase
MPDLYSWQVTMFFSDIASFTTIVESMPPQKSLLLLSRYFQACWDLVSIMGLKEEMFSI